MYNNFWNGIPQFNYQQQTNTNKIYVSGLEDVKCRYTPTNSEFIFVDNEKDVIYEKKVDSKGQFTIKSFNISEILPVETAKDENVNNLSTYVKTSDLEPILEDIKILKDEITKTKAVE